MKKILLVATIATLSACATEKTPPQVGIANPASVYCIKVGGKLDIVNEKDGQVGYCTLPSGEYIKEWTLFRRGHKAG